MSWGAHGCKKNDACTRILFFTEQNYADQTLWSTKSEKSNPYFIISIKFAVHFLPTLCC
jgi:hypothetical protein